MGKVQISKKTQGQREKSVYPKRKKTELVLEIAKEPIFWINREKAQKAESYS